MLQNVYITLPNIMAEAVRRGGIGINVTSKAPYVLLYVKIVTL